MGGGTHCAFVSLEARCCDTCLAGGHTLGREKIIHACDCNIRENNILLIWGLGAVIKIFLLFLGAGRVVVMCT